jgi:hypothetical protein
MSPTWGYCNEKEKVQAISGAFLLDKRTVWTYLAVMFKRFSRADIVELQRQQWQQAKAGGKSRFIFSQGIVPTLLIWLIVLPTIDFFVDRNFPFSWRSIGLNLMILPIFLLGGYLEGRWKWKDLQKKFPVGL